jgi:very-short-patch-repair endonuclease
MRSQSTIHRDRVIGALADRQFGAVARRQLLDAGLSRATIGRAVASGRLRPVFEGVYGVGHIRLSRHGWWRAALLACGDDSALSHRSAAMIAGYERGPMFPIEVITSGQCGRKQSRLLPHRMALEERHTMILDGLRVTTPARTIVDRAATVSPRELRGLVERAQDVRRFDVPEIEVILAASPGRRGCRALRDLITLLGPDEDNARSHLERLFLRLVRRARLPLPEVNYRLAGRRRDFVWVEQRLVVETDGYRWHSSREARRRDAQRDRELTRLGWRPVRFTFEEVALDPAAVQGDLITLL